MGRGRNTGLGAAGRIKKIYEKLSKGLAKHGIEKSGEQCRCKVKKLRQEYKKIKDAHSQTGTDRKKWKFYECLNEILGNRPATCLPVVIDTSDDGTLTTGEVERTGVELEQDAAEHEGSLGNTEDNMSVLSQLEGSDLESATSSSTSTTPVSITSTSKGKK